ncbi:WXG100 family type VII secretion target [Saccharopolyspora sp. NPDC050389]|uniref:WXG100 family type VII secretion target n=1 Tax=Saccharopolyspora sp. NPDC050389 TaxID=3155516 RepID=UPI0033CE767F
MGDNPLIAQPQDSSSWYTGIGIVEAISDVSAAIESGSWAEIGYSVLGAGLEVLSAVLDPIGTGVPWLVGWLIEFVQPLTDILDWLAGNADAVAAHAQTWRNVGESLRSTADAMQADVNRDTAGWTGATADAYRSRLGATAELIRAQSQAAGALAEGTETAGMVVGTIREVVRDLIADCVGRLVSWAIEAATGVGIAAVAVQASARVARWAVRIMEVIQKLLRALGDLIPLVRKLADLLGQLRKILTDITHGNPTPQPPEKPPNAPDDPNTPRNPNDPPDDPKTGHPDPEDPFDRLPPHEQEDLIRKIIDDSRGGMTREAAIASLRDGPPGTTPFVDEKNAFGPDIRFQDSNGNDALNRENKALNGSENSFNTNTKKACKQLGKEGGEVFYQIPQGVTVDELNSWVDRWRGRRGPTDHENVNLIFCDPSGRIIGRGNLANGKIE